MQQRNARYHLGYTPAEYRSVTPVPKWVKDMVPQPVGRNETIKSGQEDVLKDTMPLIKSKIRRTLYHTAKLAAKLKGSSLTDTARNDWNFICNHIRYVKDERGKEQIRSPRRLIHEGRGDCDCFSVTISSLLLNQGIPHFLRIMKETSENGWSHIYVVVPKNGDVSKKLTSRDQYIVLDCVTHQFDFEPAHYTTKDFPMALEYLDGLSADACPTKPISERLQRYVFTDQVVESGLVPTRQFLEQKNIPAIPKPDGSFQVSTSAGMISVPSIITPTEAQKLVQDTNGIETVQAEEVQPAEASLIPEKANWIVYLLLGGLGASLIFGIKSKPVSKTAQKLSGIKSKKKLKTLHI